MSKVGWSSQQWILLAHLLHLRGKASKLKVDAPLQIGTRNILLELSLKRCSCIYIYIYMTYIYIYTFSLCLYTGIDYSLGVEGEVSVQEQAWGCVQVHLYIVCIFYMYIYHLCHCLHHYDEYTSDQQGVPVSDAGLEKPQMWGSVCHLHGAAAWGKGGSKKRAGPAWIHPSSNPPRRDAQKARAVGLLPLLRSGPQTLQPRAGSGLSMPLGSRYGFSR